MYLKQKISLFFLNKLHKNRTITKNILGYKLKIHPNVFRPDISVTSKLLAQNIKVKPTDLVLEIGTGSGIQAIVAAKHAKQVTATDINEEALKCAKQNAELNNITYIKFITSNLFHNIKEKFDVIIYSPPYLQGRPKRIIERAWYDPNYKLLQEFFKNVKKHLNKNGKIIMCYSDIADMKTLYKLAQGFKIKIIAKKNILLETIYVLQLNTP